MQGLIAHQKVDGVKPLNLFIVNNVFEIPTYEDVNLMNGRYRNVPCIIFVFFRNNAFGNIFGSQLQRFLCLGNSLAIHIEQLVIMNLHIRRSALQFAFRQG